MQSRQSGAAANDYGRRAARSIAEQLGAEPTSTKSNEFLLNGKAVTIRCAKIGTTSVGVTYLMLERVSRVLAAFEERDSSYSVWSLSPKAFKANMQATRSRGPSQGRVGIVARALFEQLGTKEKTGIRLSDIYSQ